MRLDGKTVFITGGSSGIGLATAERFIAEGASVIVVGSDQAKLERAVARLGAKARGMVADVADRDSIGRIMTTFKKTGTRLDALVVCAGVSGGPDIANLTLAAYQRIMAINCQGAAFTLVDALPYLNEGASVVFVGSVAGRKGQPGDAVYAGSKGFIRAFARSLGTDPYLMERRLRVNVVRPGPVVTPLVSEAVNDPDASKWVANMVPQHRWGRPEEVAAAILFMASDEASFTTGGEITVDGGMAHA